MATQWACAELLQRWVCVVSQLQARQYSSAAAEGEATVHARGVGVQGDRRLAVTGRGWEQRVIEQSFKLNFHNSTGFLFFVFLKEGGTTAANNFTRGEQRQQS